MRIYTVTKGDQALAVVRASDPTDAIDTALAMIETANPLSPLHVRDPNDAEMVGWLERRNDYLVAEPLTA